MPNTKCIKRLEIWSSLQMWNVYVFAQCSTFNMPHIWIVFRSILALQLEFKQVGIAIRSTKCMYEVRSHKETKNKSQFLTHSDVACYSWKSCSFIIIWLNAAQTYAHQHIRTIENRNDVGRHKRREREREKEWGKKRTNITTESSIWMLGDNDMPILWYSVWCSLLNVQWLSVSCLH